MSVSAIFGIKLAAAIAVKRQTVTSVGYSNGIGEGKGVMIECSSRPQKKATAHHRKSRPKKTQPWDKNRGPTVYPPLPELPPEWSFVTEKVEASPSANS
ncbi:hypothetical protein QVD17_36363 [Tagetes erecta]|uniref:50S ribosomal protein 6, chloroplastic n=1 Tax=Tagetes erecta TaxID=13708 RepID=A0AAD8NHC3_TARER|nr:hypothetical protein QVD17_36363 [Tagetes erecta]